MTEKLLLVSSACALALACSRGGVEHVAKKKAVEIPALQQPAAREPTEAERVSATEPELVSAPSAQYLGAFSAADVQRAAARSGAPDARLSWRMRPWNARPDTLLVLSFVALDPNGAGLDIAQLRPEIAVLEKRGTDLQRVAAAPVPIDADSCVCDPTGGCIEAPKVDFDAARYRVATDHEAFGVRLTCHWTAAAAEGELTRLTLFELNAGLLRELLSREVGSDTSDRVCGCSMSSETTVHILGSQHAGFYDLRLQTRHRKEPFFEDVPLAEPAQPPSNQRVTWDGTRYVDVPSTRAK